MEAQARALADRLPESNSAPNTTAGAPAEKMRFEASEEEIQALVAKLPDGLRLQMEELFRARYTRIQKLDSKQNT